MSEDLQNVKVGDKLIAFGMGGSTRIVTVERLTATQVVCGKTRFNRRGHELGSGSRWLSEYARPATPQEVDDFTDRVNARRARIALVQMLEDSSRVWASSVINQAVKLLEDMELKPTRGDA